MNNVTEDEVNPHPCYWCGGKMFCQQDIPAGGGYYFTCEKCAARGPRSGQHESFLKWNSLASRLKPQPKVVTLKRWVNVYVICDETGTSDTYETKEAAIEAIQSQLHGLQEADVIDTVEVEITFTDRRGCE